jgi:hypothetical protein
LNSNGGTLPVMNSMVTEAPQASVNDLTTSVAAGAGSARTVVAAPLVTSSPSPLRKFNFSSVSKLELVGTTSSPAYLTLVERRYTVHLVAKVQAGSKV